jgi:hypothetical protein
MSAGAFGAAVQTALGSAATVTAPLDGIRTYTDAPQYETDVPSYKTNSGNTETHIVVKTRQGQVQVEGDVTSTNIVPLLNSAFGAGVSGVFLSGGVQKYLSARWNEPDDLILQHWLAQDLLVDTFELQYSLDNPLRFRATLKGPVQTVVGSAWTTAVTPGAGLGPFSPWQVYLTKDGAVACVTAFNITLNNNLQPVYCSPQAEPDNSTPAGLTPTKYNRDPTRGAQVRVDASYSYVGDVGSSYEAFRNQAVENNWVWHASDPRTGATADVLSELPAVGYLTGEIVRDAQVKQHLTGAALFDATTGAAWKVTVTT